MLLALVTAVSSLTPAPRAALTPLRAPLVSRRPLPVASEAEATPSDAASAAAAPVDKELSGSTIRYDGLSEDMQQLVEEALVRRDRTRLIEGKPKYNSVQGMVDAYVELGKPKGWTREDAESEVVRYLQRQALRSEGGLDGAAQELPTFALLALVIVSAGYGYAVKIGLLPGA
tara:strand:- start:210 stop:728 length:519 start_codon:yes stop_codon:yes gene_type:complete